MSLFTSETVNAPDSEWEYLHGPMDLFVGEKSFDQGRATFSVGGVSFMLERKDIILMRDFLFDILGAPNHIISVAEMKYMADAAYDCKE